MKNSSISPSTIKPNMPHSVFTLAICNEDELGVLHDIFDSTAKGRFCSFLEHGSH